MPTGKKIEKTTNTTNIPKSSTMSGNGEELYYKSVAITVSMENSSWGYVLRYAVGWFLMPALAIVSKLFKKRINF